MEEFKKYPSIENSYRQAFIEKIRLHGYGQEKYCITEKIHGSNTQIAYNVKNGTFTYGKRTEALLENEACYGVQDIFDTLHDKVKSVANYLGGERVLESVIIFGEIFGGSYPHPDVPKNNKAKKCQKGIWYSPNNEWRAFDIAYKTALDENYFFLSAKDFFFICEKTGIPAVPLLKVCDNLSEALEYPNDGLSVVYKYYDLPEIKDNIMEGVVIKPYEKDLWMGQTRVVIKNKSEKFSEKVHESKEKVEIVYSSEVKEAIEKSLEYITENRINNIISHLGEITAKDIGKIIGLTSKDVIEEVKKDKILDGFEKADEKLVTNFIQKQVVKLVRKTVLCNL